MFFQDEVFYKQKSLVLSLKIAYRKQDEKTKQDQLYHHQTVSSSFCSCIKSMLNSNSGFLVWEFNIRLHLHNPFINLGFHAAVSPTNKRKITTAAPKIKKRKISNGQMLWPNKREEVQSISQRFLHKETWRCYNISNRIFFAYKRMKLKKQVKFIFILKENNSLTMRFHNER